MVRVWTPEQDDEPDAAVAGLRGEVEHTRTGVRRRFTTMADLAEALGGALGPSTEG